MSARDALRVNTRGLGAPTPDKSPNRINTWLVLHLYGNRVNRELAYLCSRLFILERQELEREVAFLNVLEVSVFKLGRVFQAEA
jgi:hypothetical protein